VTIAEQLKVIAEALKPLVGEVKAAQWIEIETSVEGLFGRFAEGAPEGVRAVVMFTGEDLREPNEGGLADRSFLVVTSVGKGFLAPGDATRGALYQVVEDARQLLRGIQFEADTTEVTPVYKGNGIFTMPDGRPVNAFQHTITIGVQLPAPG
jgi:hypothetical protein